LPLWWFFEDMAADHFFGILNLSYWNLFEIWILEFGICLPFGACDLVFPVYPGIGSAHPISAPRVRYFFSLT